MEVGVLWVGCSAGVLANSEKCRPGYEYVEEKNESPVEFQADDVFVNVVQDEEEVGSEEGED